MMVDRANQDVSRFFRVEDTMGLESKAAVAGRQFVDRLPNAWEICEQADVRSRRAWYASAWYCPNVIDVKS